MIQSIWISHDDPKKWNDSSVLRSWWYLVFLLIPLQNRKKTERFIRSVLSVKTHLRALHLPGVSLEPSFTEETEEHGLCWKLVGLFFWKFETCWMMVDVEPQVFSILEGFVKSSNDPFFVLHTDLRLERWIMLNQHGSSWITAAADEDYTVLMPAELDRLDLIAWPWIVFHDRMDCTILHIHVNRFRLFPWSFIHIRCYSSWVSIILASKMRSAYWSSAFGCRADVEGQKRWKQRTWKIQQKL